MISSAIKNLMKKYTARAADGSREASRLYRGSRLRSKVAARSAKEKAREIDKSLQASSPTYGKAKSMAKSVVDSEYVESVLKLAGKSTSEEASILNKQAKAIEKSIRRMQQIKRSDVSEKVMKRALAKEADKIKHAKKIVNEVKAGKYARTGVTGGLAAYLASDDNSEKK